MTVNDWVLIGTSLFLGVTALFVPYLSELVKRKAFAPNLILLFELTPPYCHKTRWRSLKGGNLDEPVYFFRFQIFNNGRSQARRCEATLEGLWIFDAAGKPQAYPNFSPVNLLLDDTGKVFADINPRRRIYWNIGHISSRLIQDGGERAHCIDIPGQAGNELRFVFDQERVLHSQPNCVTPGKFGIKISIFSENAPNQELYFQIAWSGKWQDSESEMFREIVVTQVDRI